MLVLVGGLIAFSTYTSPAIVDLAAIAFGGGAALVLDEFALVFHLEDVYWEDEGRQSVVATVLGAAVIVLMLVLTAPPGCTPTRSPTAAASTPSATSAATRSSP